jgi:hypothetical protein
MSDNQKHNKSYSASDIRNYLDGKLSPAEMHAIEKAAMDDPLLSDALEGIELSGRRQNIFASDTEELRKRLQERIQQRKRNRIFPFLLQWRAAAVWLLLAGAGTLSYFFLTRKADTDRNISLMSKKNKITDTFIQNNDIPVSPASGDSAPGMGGLKIPNGNPDTVSVAFNDKSIPRPALFNRRKATDEKKKREGGAEAFQPSPAKKAPKPESPAVATVAPKEFSSRTSGNKINTDSQPAPAVALEGKAAGVQARGVAGFNKQNPAAFKKQDKPDRNFYLQGTVADTNGIPISGATVMLKRTKEAVSTDSNGMFKLETALPDSNQYIAINSAGYQSESIVINPSENKERLIRLSPVSNDLSEVVVVGYGTRKRETVRKQKTVSRPKKKSLINSAEPVTGWTEYNNYINKNKKIYTADSLLKGTEIISFIINKNGTLSSFRIEKSVSPAHDAKVLQLLRGGPAWKLNGRKKHRYRLAIDFNQ